MGLGQRNAKRHETRGIQSLAAGVEPTRQYEVGQRVITVDGFPGQIIRINDGDLQGNENFHVLLDNGIGGGQYSSSQIKPLATKQAEGQIHTADQDYPELGTILVDRPDIAIPTRMASKTAADATPEFSQHDYSNVAHGEAYQPSPTHKKKHRPGATCPYCKYWGMGCYPGERCPLCGHQMVDPDDVGKQVHDPDDFTDADKDEEAEDTDEGAETESGGSDADASGESAGGDSGGDSDGGGSTTASIANSSVQDHIIAQAIFDPDFAFHVTAAWSDVRNKAKRIRSEGGVHIKLASDGYVIADVRGDHNVYETGIQRMPGKVSAASWSCGCKWGSYHWGAPDDYSRFAGRMCSHALALQFEAQSRGMFGREIYEDDKKPKWVPKRVVVKYDIDEGKDIRAKASNSFVFEGSLAEYIASLGEDDVYYTLLAIEGSVNSPFGDVIEEQQQPTPGATKPHDANANPASAGFASAPDAQGWGDMSVKTRDAEGVGSVYGSQKIAHCPVCNNEDVYHDEDLGVSICNNCGVPHLPENPESASKYREFDPHREGQIFSLNALDVDREEFLFEADLDLEATLRDEPEAALPQTDGSEATLHDEPEAALPTTDGGTEPRLVPLPNPNTPRGDISVNRPALEQPWLAGREEESLSDYQSLQSQGSVDDIVASFQATAKHLDKANQPIVGDSDIAKAAQQYLAKTSMKDFTPAEQAALINEGEDRRASNYDRLNIVGTHYEQVEAALQQEDEEGFLW